MSVAFRKLFCGFPLLPSAVRSSEDNRIEFSALKRVFNKAQSGLDLSSDCCQTRLSRLYRISGVSESVCHLVSQIVAGIFDRSPRDREVKKSLCAQILLARRAMASLRVRRLGYQARSGANGRSAAEVVRPRVTSETRASRAAWAQDARSEPWRCVSIARDSAGFLEGRSSTCYC